VGTDELGAAQDATGKLGTTQIGTQESGLRQIGMLHMRTIQARLRKVSAHQPCVSQDGITHIVPDQTRLTQISTCQVGITEVAVGEILAAELLACQLEPLLSLYVQALQH
jgi:hypothetical protein